MGRTLWEILTTKKVTHELKHYNPLGLKIGSIVKINTVDTIDHNFVLKGVREVNRYIDRKDFKFCDYDVLSGDVRKRLRVIPKNEGYDIVLFEFREEFPYEEGFHEWLKNNHEVELGDLNPDDPPHYWRVNDLTKPWEAKTVSMFDANNDNVINDDELEHGKLTYWDFWRDTKDEGGNKVTEFYNIEMDQDGMFSIWVGRIIDPLQVSTL